MLSSHRQTQASRSWGNPLGVKAGTVLGETIETTPQLWEDVDTVTLYVGPARQAPYLEYIKELSPRRVIFNPGTENPEN